LRSAACSRRCRSRAQPIGSRWTRLDNRTTRRDQSAARRPRHGHRIKVENGALLQIHRLSLSVTLPGNSKGDRILPDQNNEKTLDLHPRYHGDITINSGCTLTPHTGTYFFNNWSVHSKLRTGH